MKTTERWFLLMRISDDCAALRLLSEDVDKLC